MFSNCEDCGCWLGAIALLLGILALCSIPGLSTLGTTGGAIFSAIGALMLLAGACLRCIKERTQLESHLSGTGKVLTHKEHVQYFQKENHQEKINLPHKSAISVASSDNNKNQAGVVDFAQITPTNYKQYLDISQDCNPYTGKLGDFTLKEHVCEDPLSPGIKKGKRGTWLKGTILHKDRVEAKGMCGCFSAADLEVRKKEFIYYPQMSAPEVHFSNLKDFFDYLFQGAFYQGGLTKDIGFFTLKTMDGKEVSYYNPYKNHL